MAEVLAGGVVVELSEETVAVAVRTLDVTESAKAVDVRLAAAEPLDEFLSSF